MAGDLVVVRRVGQDIVIVSTLILLDITQAGRLGFNRNVVSGGKVGEGVIAVGVSGGGAHNCRLIRIEHAVVVGIFIQGNGDPLKVHITVGIAVGVFGDITAPAAEAQLCKPKIQRMIIFSVSTGRVVDGRISDIQAAVVSVAIMHVIDRAVDVLSRGYQASKIRIIQGNTQLIMCVRLQRILPGHPLVCQATEIILPLCIGGCRTHERPGSLSRLLVEANHHIGQRRLTRILNPVIVNILPDIVTDFERRTILHHLHIAHSISFSNLVQVSVLNLITVSVYFFTVRIIEEHCPVGTRISGNRVHKR